MSFEALARKTGETGPHGSLAEEGIWREQHSLWAGHSGDSKTADPFCGSYEALELFHGLSQWQVHPQPPPPQSLCESGGQNSLVHLTVWSIRLLFFGWGFSTTQQPSLCQNSLIFPEDSSFTPLPEAPEGPTTLSQV